MRHTLLAVLAALTLAGCAATPITAEGWADGFTWFQARPAAKDTVTKVVGRAGLQRVCTSATASACSTWTPELCTIWLETADEPSFIIEHEKAHCRGMDHRESRVAAKSALGMQSR